MRMREVESSRPRVHSPVHLPITGGGGTRQPYTRISTDSVYAICNLCTRDLSCSGSGSGEHKASHCEEQIRSSFAVCYPFGSCNK